jgi:hypothetical protein
MSSSITNEKWLIAVPNSSAKGAQSAVAELNQAANQLAQMHAFQIPTLKVGTLDSLMTIRFGQRHTRLQICAAPVLQR